MQAVLVAITALMVLLVALLLFIIGLVQILTKGAQTLVVNPIYSYGIAFLTIFIFIVPFLIDKFREIAKHPTHIRSFVTGYYPSWVILLLLLGWGLILFAGYYLIGKGLGAVILMPILAVVAVTIPIFIFVSIVRKQDDPIPFSRGWGALSVGATASPVLGNLIEFGIAAIAFIIFFIFIFSDPHAVSNLQRIANRLTSAESNPEIIKNVVTSFIRLPLNKYILLSIVSGIIPIIEEIIKQTPIWLLAWRKLTPRAGLVIGALGGSGFALTESLLTTPIIGDPDQWLFQTIGRAGTGLMHVTTGAIGGWGLASAFSHKGYLKSLLVYLLAISLHAIWNGLAIWEGIGRFINSPSVSVTQFGYENNLPMQLMAGQFLVMLLFLIVNNKILKE